MSRCIDCKEQDVAGTSQGHPTLLLPPVTSSLHAVAVCMPVGHHRRLGRRQRRQTRRCGGGIGRRSKRTGSRRSGCRTRSGIGGARACRRGSVRRRGTGGRPIAGWPSLRGLRCGWRGVRLARSALSGIVRRRQGRRTCAPAGIGSEPGFFRPRRALRQPRHIDACLLPRLPITIGVVDTLGRRTLAPQRVDRGPLRECSCRCRE